MIDNDGRDALPPHIWSRTALQNKAKRYAEEMSTFAQSEWQFAFYSTFVLEFTARATLSSISPVLLAEGWPNTLFALGRTPSRGKFVPRSVDISEVFARLNELVPGFTDDMRNAAVLHMTRRNEEFHSGAVPFDDLRPSAWLPQYYEILDTLLRHMGEDLASLLGAAEAEDAMTQIQAYNDKSAKNVKASINAHRQTWQEKTSDEQAEARMQAAAVATRTIGHRVKCPACDSDALLHGAPRTSPPSITIQDDIITERQEYIPTRFECSACGLRISTLAQLNVAGLGDPFIAKHSYDAWEYYADDDMFDGWEPDFNE